MSIPLLNIIRETVCYCMEHLNAVKTVGIMATEQTKDCYKAGKILVVGDREKPETIGANLFKILRKFDYIGADVVYSEVFDEDGEGAAIMNRLNKAAAFNYIRC